MKDAKKEVDEQVNRKSLYSTKDDGYRLQTIDYRRSRLIAFPCGFVVCERKVLT